VAHENKKQNDLMLSAVDIKVEKMYSSKVKNHRITNGEIN
jgi:hypothetical protein